MAARANTPPSRTRHATKVHQKREKENRVLPTDLKRPRASIPVSHLTILITAPHAHTHRQHQPQREG